MSSVMRSRVGDREALRVWDRWGCNRGAVGERRGGISMTQDCFVSIRKGLTMVGAAHLSSVFWGEVGWRQQLWFGFQHGTGMVDDDCFFDGWA